jgi:hypothetical protein
MESLVSNRAAVAGYGPSVAPDAQRAVEFLEHVFPGASRSAFYDMVEHVEWVHVRGGELLIRHGGSKAYADEGLTYSHNGIYKVVHAARVDDLGSIQRRGRAAP